MIETTIQCCNICKTMDRISLRGTMTSLVVLCLIVLLTLDTVYADTTIPPAPTTTKEPFIKSTMFIGLAAGIGGFFAFGFLCCIVWKCFCGGEKNE